MEQTQQPSTDNPRSDTPSADKLMRTISQAPGLPSHTSVHGEPIRQYLNEHITGVLLDGLKMVAREQPQDPLQRLGEYLIAHSKDLE